MGIKFRLIDYKDLNARQKENYNFQKVSAVLAEYGFVTLRLTDDWQGADFIAQHIDGKTFLRVQLKGRLTLNKKYQGKGLYVAFPHKGNWYIYEHDKLLKKVLTVKGIAKTKSWSVKGGYSFPTLGEKLLSLLEPYKVGTKMNNTRDHSG